MSDQARGRVIGVALLAVLTIALLSEPAQGSNTAFRLVKPLALAPAGTLPTRIVRANWIALPYVNGYPNAAALCQKLGLSVGVDSYSSARVSVQGPTLRRTRRTRAFCGTAEADQLALPPGYGVDIWQPDVPGAPRSIVISGSHDPALSISIPVGGRIWYGVPYHATAKTAQDICSQTGLSAAATINRYDAFTKQSTFVTCHTPEAGDLKLVLGEHVEIYEPSYAVTFVPQVVD